MALPFEQLQLEDWLLEREEPLRLLKLEHQLLAELTSTFVEAAKQIMPLLLPPES